MIHSLPTNLTEMEKPSYADSERAYSNPELSPKWVSEVIEILLQYSVLFQVPAEGFLSLCQPSNASSARYVVPLPIYLFSSNYLIRR